MDKTGNGLTGENKEKVLANEIRGNFWRGTTLAEQANVNVETALEIFCLEPKTVYPINKGGF